MRDLLLAVGVACLVDKERKRKEPPSTSGETASAGSEKPVSKSEVIGERTPQTDSSGPIAPAPEFRPFLLSRREAAAKARWTGTLSFSAMLHGALLAGFAATSNPPSKPVIAPKYHIEILHLQQASAAGDTRVMWIPLHKAAESLSDSRNLPDRRVAGPGHNAATSHTGRAPETIEVDAAPPGVQLEKPIPLPWEISQSLHVLPPRTMDIRVAASSDSAIESGLVPVVRMKSLPDPTELAPDAAMIPKVNQSAAADIGSGTTADSGSPAGTTPSPGNNVADAASVRAAVPSPEPSGLPVPQTSGAYDWPTAPSSGAAVLANEPIDPGADLPKDVLRIDVAGSRPRMQILAESQHIPGRIVATIYLNMGLPKSWGLEYWVNGDSLSGVTPPWPFTMFRPDVVLPSNMDTLLIRARLSADGCIEDPEFLTEGHTNEPDSILRALGRWRFRPAMRNKQPIAVEILLVIPRQDRL